MTEDNLLELPYAAVLPERNAKGELKRLRFAAFTGLGQIVHHARRLRLGLPDGT